MSKSLKMNVNGKMFYFRTNFEKQFCRGLNVTIVQSITSRIGEKEERICLVSAEIEISNSFLFSF